VALSVACIIHVVRPSPIVIIALGIVLISGGGVSVHARGLALQAGARRGQRGIARGGKWSRHAVRAGAVSVGVVHVAPGV